MTSVDVIVLGAGAAGMMAAATAGYRGKSVLLIDHASKLAEKIRISGGGRCNFTNLHAGPGNYLSANPHFCKSALSQYKARDFIDLVERHGIGYHEKKLGQLFCDEGSEAIIAMLKQECDWAGVNWSMNNTINAVSTTRHGFQIETTQGTFSSASLIVATGGLSIPQIGATGIGYDIARQFGHPITDLAPALVPLTFQPDDLYPELSGIAFDAEVSIGKVRFRENVLFTHKGVSGPAILQISSYWHPGDDLCIDLLPDVNAADWLESEAHSRQLASNVLASQLPQRFARTIALKTGGDKPLCQWSKTERQTLAGHLNTWSIRPGGSQGYKKAEVTRGGVNTEVLSSKTLMSQLQPNLFFVGEVVDVTGWLGGYNFQWAWSSGFVAGSHA